MFSIFSLLKRGFSIAENMTFWFWPQMKDGSLRTKTEGCTSAYWRPTAEAKRVEHPVHAFSSPACTHQLGTSRLETSSAGSAVFTLVFWGARTSQTSWNPDGCKLALAAAQAPAASGRWGLTKPFAVDPLPELAELPTHHQAVVAFFCHLLFLILMALVVFLTDKVIWKYASGCFLMPPNWFVN